MSRLALAIALVASLSSVAAADRAFAVPPSNVQVEQIDGFMARPMPTRAEVRAALVKARAANLERFRAYYGGRVYPSNLYTKGALNVWRDGDGHYCAAATIIRMSGSTELVDRVAEDNNFIKLADVRQGALMDWMLVSGFTQAELALIQRPFFGVRNQDDGVDPELRTAETARLFALYKKIDTRLTNKRAVAAALDAATTRLLKHPELATELVYPSS